MAGSYNHCVTGKGKLLAPERLAGMLENGGDVYEAVEEMYGMIWWLATHLAEAQWPQQPPTDGYAAQAARMVERARQNYERGLDVSPGTKGPRTTEVVHRQMRGR